MTDVAVAGRSTGGKPINLAQLETELEALGVTTSGLGMTDESVHTYDADGASADFAAADQSVVDQAIDDHIALRNKTDQEYAAEFQNAATTPERKQTIRDITAGLLPRDQVPISQAEWDTYRA